jgi:hypothetical protein
MRIKLNIEYDASAEEGETKADEETALEFIEGFLQGCQGRSKTGPLLPVEKWSTRFVSRIPLRKAWIPPAEPSP